MLFTAVMRHLRRLTTFLGISGTIACTAPTQTGPAGTSSAQTDNSAPTCGVLSEGGTIASSWPTPLVSCNSQYYLIFDTDGALVLAQLGSGTYWTNRKRGGDHAVLASGDLTVYDSDNNAIWSTDTCGSTAARLTLGDVGNAVLGDGGKSLFETGPGPR